MPAFLVVLDNDVQVGTTEETKVKWLQYFATGSSAKELAKREPIRRVMMERIDPVAFPSGTYDKDDPTVACIETWLKKDKNNSQILQQWWEEKQLKGFAVLLIKTTKHKTERQEFIKEKGIACNP